MKIPGKDGKSYEVSPKDDGDDYVVRHDGEIVGGFRLEANATPTWIADAAKGRVTNGLLEKLADAFVEKGGGSMRML